MSLSDEYTCTDGTVLAFATDGSLGRLYDPYNKVQYFSIFHTHTHIYPTPLPEYLIFVWILPQVEWATDSSRMGQILYSTYNETDYDHMSKLYDYIGGGAGFHKVNSTSNAHPVSRQWEVIAKNLYKKTGMCGQRLYRQIIIIIVAMVLSRVKLYSCAKMRLRSHVCVCVMCSSWYNLYPKNKSSPSITSGLRL